MIICEMIGGIVILKRTYNEFYIGMYAITFSAFISTALMVTNTSGIINENDNEHIWINIVLLVISLLCKISTIIVVFALKRRMKLEFSRYIFSFLI